MATQAAPAQASTVSHHPHVTDLAGSPTGPPAQAPVEHQAAADPGADPDTEQVGRFTTGAQAMLTQNGGVDVVVDRHPPARAEIEGVAQQRRQGDPGVEAREVRGMHHRAGDGIHHARSSHADPLDGAGPSQASHALHDGPDHVGDPARRGCDLDLVSELAGVVDQRPLHLGAAQIDPDGGHWCRSS